MSLDEILLPLSTDHACGDNVRLSPSLKETYFQIKDARNRARSFERAQNPDDGPIFPSDWKEVDRLAVDLLSQHTKDIELLAWLAEARLRLHGFAGLRDVYAATTHLLSEHGNALHSIDGEPDERFSPLAGLNGSGTEGTLIQPIRLSALIPGAAYGSLSLWDYQLAQREGETEQRETLYQAASDAGKAAMAAHLQSLSDCLAAFDAMSAVLDRLAGDHAPSSSNIRNALLESAAAIRMIAAFSDADEPASSLTAESADASDHQPVHAAKPPSGAIGSREEAFETLTAVARYFRRNEPHSPIALTVETLVRRGRMDFAELLAELLPEHGARNAVLTAAGIQPREDATD